MPPEKPTYEISATRRTACSVEKVMRVLRDPATWPEWQSEIIETEGPIPLEQGDEVSGRARLLGFEVDGRSETVEATTKTFHEDVIVGVRMRVSYEVNETPSGTIITRRLTAFLPEGLSGRVLSFFLKRRLKAMQEGALEALVAHAEGA